MNKLLAVVFSGMYRLWQGVKKNPKVAAMMYGTHNRNLFSSVDQHERMLACKVRVDTYHAAIHKYVSEGDIVMDVGSGTGILSFFASQKKPKHIYAVDHGDIIELAKYLSEKNGIKNISFVHSHSSDFNPPQKVDIIIQEQIGDFLVDEDMIRNICDLRDRILAPGGKILPNEFDMFLEPITLKENHRTPFLWERDLHGVRFDSSKEWLLGDLNKIGKTKLYHRLLPGEASHFLCDPKPLFSFDLMTVQPDTFPNKYSDSKQVSNEGILDGFCLYFNIRFDEELNISTNPFDKPTVWLYQLFRTEPIYCQKGDIINIELDMKDQTKVSSWNLTHVIKKVKPMVKEIN
ncbi:50S ribosomal protein L11 methyltransferase [Lunatibacter salilacus]|uniref:50S ribosomal protein L11 methyltransferase n=1 Tax=Lunatibacter salilacus TaxID=2483804 RepID=UPI00131E12AA|nr:50S ribosomal protein L11 methyltransferase [Lunatibacter salilacus]